MSTDLNVIREAARLMRERAKAACPGPWFTNDQSARYGGIVAASCDGHPEDRGYGGHLIGESMSPVNKEYIASWHPAVALTVADWLDAQARDLASAEGKRGACDSPGDVDMALRVARAYLGEPQ